MTLRLAFALLLSCSLPRLRDKLRAPRTRQTSR